MDSRVIAIWNQEQVDKLNRWQSDGRFHPFTCECGNVLTATVGGWVCSKCPDYHQDWAWAFMVEHES